MTAPNGGTPTAGTPTVSTTTATPAVPAAPAQSTTSSRPTASPAQAGHNPNVVLARHQMTAGQRRALDRRNASEIENRDAVVDAYLRSVLPSDEEETSSAGPSSGEPAPAPAPEGSAEADAASQDVPNAEERDAAVARDRELFDQQFGGRSGESQKGGA